MDKNFIYGKLNNDAIVKQYSGVDTDTAQIVVDNREETLEVNVKKVPHKLKIDYWDQNELVDIEYDGSEEKTLHIPQVGEVNQLKADVERLDNQINDPEHPDNPNSIVNEIASLQDEKEDVSNKVTTISSESTDAQYASAKCVYNRLVDEADARREADVNLFNDINLVNDEIRTKIVPASKQQMGMVWYWQDTDGTIYLSAEDPEIIHVEETLLEDGSTQVDIQTYNYSTQTLLDGSTVYNIGD